MYSRRRRSLRAEREPRRISPGRSSHDYPALELLIDGRAELLEASDFGGNVVRLDVDVHAALVIDALDLDADLIWPIFKHH